MKDNLCDSCHYEFATCKSDPKFASDIDDRVIFCMSYRNINILWKCYFCGNADNSIYSTLCSGCGRHK